MSCQQYRNLIQHRFDEELDSDDVVQVDDHIDACESCAKFEHQLDQMIQGAEEMPLLEELTPPNPEALAKMIQNQLPQQKSSVFAMFSNLFGGGGGGGGVGAAPARAGARGSKRPSEKTEFPKRAPRSSGGGGGGGGTGGERRSMAPTEDEVAMSSRLKSMSREPDDSREMQSTTRGLGEKFGLATGTQSTTEASGTPLTLAESIRRKISESQKITTGDEEDPTGGQDRLTSPAADGGGGWNSPIKMPGLPTTEPAWSSGGGGTGSSTWTPAAASMAPHPGSSIGLSPPGEGESSWEDRRPPKGTAPGDDESGWGPPPAGGSWEDPNGQAKAEIPWQSSPAGQQGGSWGGAPQAGTQEPGWSAPGQKEADSPAGSWGAGAQPSWGNSASPTQTDSDQFASGGWNVPSAKTSQVPDTSGAGASWGQSQDNWGQSATSGSSWGTPPAQEPANPPAGQKGDAWSDAGAGASWNVPKGQEDSNSGAWTQPKTNSGTGDSWGGDNSSWGAGAQAQPKAESWGQKPPAQAAAQPQSNTNDAWNKQQNNESGGAGAWGTPPPAPEQNNWGAQQNWGANQSESAGTSWGAPPTTPPAANPAPGPASTGWGTPAQQPAAQKPQPPAGDWTAKPGDQSAGWGGENNWMPPANKPQEAPGWGAQQSSSWDAASPQQQSWNEKSGAGADKGRGNWSIEAEQMETGTWSNFPGAGANNTSALEPKSTQPSQQGAAPEDRWDTSIQDRGPEPAPAMPPGAAPAPAAAQSGNSHWDMPIQEKLKSKPDLAPPTQPAAGAWGMPPVQAPAASLPTPAASLPTPTAPPPAADESHWDLPIQEKMKQQKVEPGQAGSILNAPGGPEAGQVNVSSNPTFGAPSQPPFGQAPAPPVAPTFSQPPAAPPPPSFQSFAQQQQPSPQYGAPPAQSEPAPPSAVPPWSAPAPAPANQPNTIFGRQLDDRAMDKIFDENLGIKDSAASVTSGGSPVPPAAPPIPPTISATAPQSATAPSLGAPPPQAPVPDTMSFAPPHSQATDAPRFTSIPPKGGDQSAAPPAPLPPQMPPAPAPTPAPVAAPAPAPRNKGMFNLDDNAVDAIFAKIGVEESSIPVNQAQPAPQPGMPAPPAMQQQPAPPPPAMPGMGMGMPGMPPAMPPAMPPGMAPPAPPSIPPSGFNNVPAPTGFGGVASAPMPMPPQAQPPQPGVGKADNSLFAVDDADMDNLFDKVLINPVPGMPFGGQAPAPPPAMPPQTGMPPQHPMGGYPPGNGQNMAIGGAPQYMPQQPPAPPAMAHVPPSTPPPKIEGIGKLDASADVQETGSGRIAAIGKFLLDQKDLEKLSKITAADQQDIKMRILTLEASEDLQTLLSEIGGQEKVIGSVIVGHDGLLIANTMPEEVDAESIGVWALGVYMNTEHVTKKMGHERVHQVVSRTPRGYVVIADFGGGLLVTITEGTDTDTLIPLMRKITDLVS
ncbi:MAG: roadblock/LC7 domain-containing protein [Candidatus Obscuribacterales bacterium]|nr:roadblock/LC7 domain-containing protein [Candidatus Obscuribacterales bacterium]